MIEREVLAHLNGQEGSVELPAVHVFDGFLSFIRMVKLDSRFATIQAGCVGSATDSTAALLHICHWSRLKLASLPCYPDDKELQHEARPR